MKVLFGQSYYLRFDPKLEEAMQPYPPLGTLLAAAAVRDAGHDVAVFDAMLAEGEHEWAAALEREQPEVAVLFEDNFNYLSKMCLLRMRDAALTMISAAVARGVRTVVCGSDASDEAALYLGAGAGQVLLGEGDETLVELLATLAGPDPTCLDSVTGLAHLDRHGEVHRTADRPNLKALDGRPLPARDLVDLDRYRRRWLDHHGRFSLNVVTTRGCPYHCNWCAKPIWGQRYNARSPEDVVTELVHLAETADPDHIWFADDIFGLKPGWIDRYAELVEAHDVRLPFKCLSRPDLLVRGATAEALGRAGCETVWIGAESGSQTVLDAMEKGTTVDQIREAAARVHDAGYEIGFFLQFGYPGETLDDIEATLALVREAAPDDIGMSVAYPLPGTKFHERVLDQLGDVRHWVDSDDLAMLFEGPYPTELYRHLHAALHLEFRSRRTVRRLLGSRRTVRRLLGIPSAGRQPTLRELAAVPRDLARLPLERRAVRRTAAGHEPSVARLPVELDRGSAGEPTPQEVAVGLRPRSRPWN